MTHSQIIIIKMITRILILLPLITVKLWTAELQWETNHSQLVLTPKQASGEIVFRAQNLSEQVVEIDRIESSCGCTVSKITHLRIPPGKKTEVKAKFEKKGRKQSSQVQLRVYLKGQNEASETLSISVDIHTAIRIKPAIVYWRKGELEVTRELEVVLDPRYAAGIKAIEYDTQQFEVKTQPSDTSANYYQIQIKPLATTIPIQANITIRSQGKNGYASERTLLHAYVRP